jgi:hypothetical protein
MIIEEIEYSDTLCRESRLAGINYEPDGLAH